VPWPSPARLIPRPSYSHVWAYPNRQAREAAAAETLGSPSPEEQLQPSTPAATALDDRGDRRYITLVRHAQCLRDLGNRLAKRLETPCPTYTVVPCGEGGVFSGTAMKIDPNAAAGEIRGLTTAFSDVW